MLNHNYIGTEHILLGLIHEGEGRRRQGPREPRHLPRRRARAGAGDHRPGPAGPDRSHPLHPAREEGPRVLAPRGAPARPQIHRDRAHPARPHPRGRGRRRPGPRQARRRPQQGAPAGHPAARGVPGRPGREGRRGRRPGPGQAEGTPAGSLVLDQFGRNLTQAAREGKLDPVIGREKEIERVMQVLSRRTKNNPVLIGEPGVGKTAVVEGLAQDIVRGDGARRRSRTSSSTPSTSARSSPAAATAVTSRSG